MPRRSRLPPAAALAALALLAPGAAPAGEAAVLLFADGFEPASPRPPPELHRGPGAWQAMEEPGPCHGVLMGHAAPSRAAARTGDWGYEVWANDARLPLNNHVFGANLVAQEAHVAPLRYEVWAARDPATGDTTQAGPEFGVQVTHYHEDLGQWRTTTFGFQYTGRPGAEPNWSLWAEDPASLVPDVAAWRTVFAQDLPAGAWHRFVLEADLRVPAYRALRVEGPGWAVDVPGVAGLPVAREVKWREAATWVHVDATNLWNTCGLGPPLGVTEARVWYDDVRLERLPP